VSAPPPFKASSGEFLASSGNAKNSIVVRPRRYEERLAEPTGFEPAISCVTGRCVKPGYTTAPLALAGGLEPPTSWLTARRSTG
jgi:hypothetical protein